MRPLLLALALAAPAAAAPKTPHPKIPVLLNAPMKSLRDWRALKGKVVYVEFWATWCAPCVAGIPRTNRLIESLKGAPVVFLALSDEDPAVVRAFLKTHEVRAWVGVDPRGSAFKEFHVGGRPDGYLIGRDGALLAHIAPDDLKESDVRDAVAGTFEPQPIDWGAAPKAAAAAPDFFAVRVGPPTNPDHPGMTGDLGELSANALPFFDAVATAWDVRDDQVIVDSAPVAAFDFSLRAPPEDFEEARGMLQAAIEASFGVRVEPLRRTADAFELRLSTAPGAPRPKPGAADAKPGLLSYGGGRLLGKIGMADAARALSMSVGAQVFDATGLKGEYGFDLEWTFNDPASLARALASQGLALVPARRKVDFLRVTSAKR